MSKYILFLPRATKVLKEWWPVISKVSQNNLRPLVVIDWVCNDSWILRLRDHGVEVIFRKSIKSNSENIVHTKIGIKNILLKLLPKQILIFAVTLRVFYMERLYYLNIFSQYDICAIFVAGESNVYRCAPMVVAKRFLAKSIMLPIYYLEGLSDARAMLYANYLKERSDCIQFINWLAAKLIPNLSWCVDGQLVLHNPGGEAFAMYMLGVLPKNPWVAGTGISDIVLVDSCHQKNLMVLEGVEDSKVIVTGKPRWDVLFDEMSKVSLGVQSKYICNISNKTILLSPPHLGEHSLLPWDLHWQEIDYLFREISSLKSVNILISLYPDSNRADYVAIASKYGLDILDDDDLFMLMPYCDLYIANSASSTFKIAIACNKKGIAINFWGLSDYESNKNSHLIEIVYERESLLFLIDKQLGEKSNPRVNDGFSNDFIIDGRCTDRVLNAINAAVN